MVRQPLQFDFEGQRIMALEGDTIASALLRAGVAIFSRGPKYHRPRGPFCLSGHCAQCHMRVDGEPNVATCETAAHNGQTVRRQNALGSADADILRAVDFLFPQKLDHHHLNTAHPLLTAATQALTHRLAGIGEAPTDGRTISAGTVIDADVVVIGGGRSGLAAARSCTGRVHLVEQQASLGGRRLDGTPVETSLPGHVQVHLSTRVMGLYEEGGLRLVLVRGPQGLVQLRTHEVVLAAGGIERTVPFGSNDLPGVFGGRGLLAMARATGVRPGQRVVVVGSDPDAPVVARGLVQQGFTVAGLVDTEGALGRPEGLPTLVGARPVRALGRRLVRGLEVQEADGHTHRVACNLIAVVAPLAPAYELASEVGAQAIYERSRGGFVLPVDAQGRSSVPWVRVAGRAAFPSESLASRPCA